MSPIVGGAPVKGPADRLMAPLGIEVSCVGVARDYAPFCGTLVIDAVDARPRRRGRRRRRARGRHRHDDAQPRDRGRARAPHARRRRLIELRAAALSIIPIEGIGEIRPGDELAVLIADAAAAQGHAARRRRLPRRHAEDRVEGRGRLVQLDPDRPRRARAGSSSRSRCASCAAAATSSSARPGTASCARTPASTSRTSTTAGPRCCPSTPTVRPSTSATRCAPATASRSA